MKEIGSMTNKITAEQIKAIKPNLADYILSNLIRERARGSYYDWFDVTKLKEEDVEEVMIELSERGFVVSKHVYASPNPASTWLMIAVVGVK